MAGPLQHAISDQGTTVVYRGETSARRRFAAVRMLLTTIEESYFMTKNVLDHAVGITERLAFGQKYLPSRLARYRGQKRIAFLYHGYAQGRWAFERLERLLESEPFNVFGICGGYQPYSQDIRRSAEYELRTIEYVLRETDVEEVILIGHSQGGLIVRYLLQALGVTAVANVTRALYLCTPHRGTWAACAGVAHGAAAHALARLPGVSRKVELSGESALQMIPGSSFLKDLNARPLPSSVAHTSLYNTFDPAVWPARFARLPYPEATNILFQKIGHLHALYDIQELEVILRSILVPKGNAHDRSRTILQDQPVLEERVHHGEDADYEEFEVGSD
jgi:triacylglycerol esterase/lipase EstA (alpha/beta hydrolase family)